MQAKKITAIITGRPSGKKRLNTETRAVSTERTPSVDPLAIARRAADASLRLAR